MRGSSSSLLGGGDLGDSLSDFVERSDVGLGVETSLLRKTVSISSVDSVDSVDGTWNVELSSLVVAPSEDLVLPAAEYSGTDVIGTA